MKKIQNVVMGKDQRWEVWGTLNKLAWMEGSIEWIIFLHSHPGFMVQPGASTVGTPTLQRLRRNTVLVYCPFIRSYFIVAPSRWLTCQLARHMLWLSLMKLVGLVTIIFVTSKTVNIWLGDDHCLFWIECLQSYGGGLCKRNCADQACYF